MDHARTGYSTSQIALHWIIAALVVFQLVFGEAMNAVMRASERGITISASDQWWGDAHYWVGMAILALAAIRMAVRVVAGAPVPLGNGWTVKAAQFGHAAFYVLLLAAPVLGILGFYLGEPWDDIHTLCKPLFIILIALHVLGALYHQFWLKDGTLRRIVVPPG